MMRKIFLTLFMLLISLDSYAGIRITTAGTSFLNCGTADTMLQENQAQTVGAWIIPYGNGGGGFGRIISKGLNTGGYSSRFTMDLTTAISLGVTGATSLARISNNGAITFGVPQYAMYTWDGSITATNSHIYVNGVEVSYSTSTNMLTPTDNSAGIIGIGNRDDGLRNFNGVILEVEVWNAVLSASQIAQAYNSGKQGNNMKLIAPESLVSWWRLNDCPEGQACNSTYTDEMGRNNCTGSGSPLGFAPGYSFSRVSTLKSGVLK